MKPVSDTEFALKSQELVDKFLDSKADAIVCTDCRGAFIVIDRTKVKQCPFCKAVYHVVTYIKEVGSN